MQEGLWSYYYESGGAMTSYVYKAGNQTGETKGLYESGYTRFLGQLVNGEPEKEWTWWHEHGTTESKVTYKNGLKQGTQFFWSESERLSKEEVYENGIIMAEKIY